MPSSPSHHGLHLGAEPGTCCWLTRAQLYLWSGGQAFHLPSFSLNDSAAFDQLNFPPLLLNNESLGGKERPEVGPKTATAFYEHNGCLTFISKVNIPEGVSPSWPLIDKICSLDKCKFKKKRKVGVDRMGRSRNKMEATYPSPNILNGFNFIWGTPLHTGLHINSSAS